MYTQPGARLSKLSSNGTLSRESQALWTAGVWAPEPMRYGVYAIPLFAVKEPNLLP